MNPLRIALRVLYAASTFPLLLPPSRAEELTAAGQAVAVNFEAPNIVHVTKRPVGLTAVHPSLIIVKQSDTATAVTRADEPARVVLQSAALRVTIDKGNGAVTFYDLSDTLNALLQERGAARLEPSPEPDGVSAATCFALTADEGIYGLGQHQSGFMNYRGHAITLVQANTESSNPFLVSTRGYGILWDNYSKTVVADEKDGLWFRSEIGDGVDYHFVAGGSMDGAIAGYRQLTGQAPMYGKWAYGYFQSKEHYQTRDEVLAAAAGYRERHLPLDCIVQDWDYWGEGNQHWNQLIFDPKTYPNPGEMIDTLHRENVHFMISIWCGFGQDTAVYRDMEHQGFLLRPVGWAGFRYFDAYNPAAKDLYWSYVNEGLFRYGVDGWWMDSTEPDIVNACTKAGEEYEMKRTGRNYLGSFARYLNTYPLEATENVYRHQRATTESKRVYILTRSAFAGQQRAAATTWSGDIGASWDVFRHQIPAGINHSMSGLPYWTFDIGAFVLGSYGGVFNNGGKDPAYQELYTRMFQFGAFCPIFRSHGSETPREIWEFGDFSPVLARYDRLRYRLLPYIYANAWKITHDGASIMRALPMDFPTDGDTFGIDDQFMFGSSIMACPVTTPMLHRAPSASVPMPASVFHTVDGRPGLEATYFSDDHFGTPVHSGSEPDISLDWYVGWPSYIHEEKFSMRWEGTLTPTESGPHRLHFKTFGPRDIRIDGRRLKFTYAATEAVSDPVVLEAGHTYRFSCATSNSVLGAFKAILYWKTPSMLAADREPLNTAQTRPVYLPGHGEWYDFWTGKPVRGGQTIEAPAPIDRMPLYVRAGSIVPMGPVIEYANEQPSGPLEVRIYPGADATFTLYDDEGDNYGYEHGAYATTRLSWNDKSHTLTIGKREGSYPGMPASRVLNCVIVSPEHGSGDAVSAAQKSVTYDGAEQSVQL